MADIEITLDLNHKLTTFTVNGKLSADEITSAVKDFYEGQPTKHVLWDLSNAASIDIRPEDIQNIILIARKYSGKRDRDGKTAIVTQRDLDFGLGRMYESYTETYELPYGYSIFREPEEALEWLLKEV